MSLEEFNAWRIGALCIEAALVRDDGSEILVFLNGESTEFCMLNLF